MLRICVLDFKQDWDQYLPLVEFAYNNSYHSSIGMPPYEALYGRKCRSPLCWTEVEEKYVEGPDLIREIVEKVPLIQGRLKTVYSRQQSYADPKRTIFLARNVDRVSTTCAVMPRMSSPKHPKG